MERWKNTESDDKFDVMNKNILELNQESADAFCKRCFAVEERADVIFEDVLKFDTLDENVQFLSDGGLRDFMHDFLIDGSLPTQKNICNSELVSAFRQIGRIEEIVLCSHAVTACRERFGIVDSEILAGALLRSNLASFDDGAVTGAKRSGGADKIACLKNSYTDKAYDRFKHLFYEPSVSYCENFVSVCEEVYYGNANFCILPVENSKEGRLSSFYQLIRKYDLKIVSCCTAHSANKDDRTKFALLKKSFDFDVLYRDELYFEFFATLDDTDLLSDILSAVTDFGLKIVRVDSLPLEYSDAEYSYDLVIKVEKSRFADFLCYLKIKAPRFVPLGLYDFADTGATSRR